MTMTPYASELVLEGGSLSLPGRTEDSKCIISHSLDKHNNNNQQICKAMSHITQRPYIIFYMPTNWGAILFYLQCI